MNNVRPILHIAPTPFFSNRGCHIRIRNEVEALQSSGQRVIVCTYHHGKAVSGIDTRRIRPIPGYTKVSAGYSPYKFLADLLLLFLVIKVTLQEKPRLLHAHLHEGVLIGWLASRSIFWRRIPLVGDMQGSLSGELEAYGTFAKDSLPIHLFRLIEKLISRLADIYLCSSVAVRNLLRTQFRRPLHKVGLLPDFVPPAFFESYDKEHARGSLGLPLDRPIVIYSGSLLRGKGIDSVLNALLYFATQPSPPLFVLLGYPVEPIATFVKRHGVETNCLLTGEVAYDQLSNWLAAADVALEPKASTSAEASGKLLHYMAAGLPVVAYDHAGNRAMLNTLGFFASLGDQEGFVRAIETALADPTRAASRGQRGRKVVAHRYSLNRTSQFLIRTYNRL